MKPIPRRENQKWIDCSQNDYRTYIVSKCVHCQKLFWHRSDYPTHYCSPKCSTSKLMKFNGRCLLCTKQIPRTSPRGKQFIPMKFCSKPCAWKHFVKQNHPNWSGGSYINRNGYRMILVGKKLYVPEHRIIMETFLGRSLKHKEVVHHKNGKKTDNRLKNLEVFKNADHSRHHDVLGKWSRAGNHWSR